MKQHADAIVVGAGLAGLVATCELLDAGRRIILVDQEPEQSLGGQAFWSFGGIFLVDSKEQRRLRIRDSRERAWHDWQQAAGFDRDEDHWPRRWAEAYVDWAAGEKRSWLRARGLRFFPIVGWAERRFNSVPRFHVTWGTGPGVIEPFVQRVRDGQQRGLVDLRFRHQVDAITTTNGVVDGVRGHILEPSSIARGEASTRTAVGDFELHASAVIVTAGGIGGNHELVRKNWPGRMGSAPQHMLSGVPAHVDGRMVAITEAAGAAVINRDRMWHYVEGLHNWNPIWSQHGIRILPGPSSIWLDARGNRLPAPLFPGFDTLGTLEHLRRSGHDHSWFILTQKIIAREFALSGSEQNPDLTNKSWRQVLGRARGGNAPAPVEAFKRHGVDFIVERDLANLVRRMNELAGEALLDETAIEALIAARDRDVDSDVAHDEQVNAIRSARHYIGDRLIRTAKPHRILDPANGPLIAVRLSVLTRKTLGGLHTDLSARVLDHSGNVIPGLFAAGEIAGFGGGGMHGYRALEGTFLGGCIFSGRAAGRALR